MRAGALKHTTKCLVCKKDFKLRIRKERNNIQKYCSRKCYYKAHRKEYVCTVCGKVFSLQKAIIKHGSYTGQYCSKPCYYKTRKGQRLAPQTEFKKGIVPIGGIGTRFMCGKDHLFWKGGITKEYDRIKRTPEYKQWRNKVYRRDFWTCQECGVHCEAKNIAAHHIRSFADYPRLRFDINNGVTFCRSCHLTIHNKLKSGALCVLAA